MKNKNDGVTMISLQEIHRHIVTNHRRELVSIVLASNVFGGTKHIQVR